MRRRIILESGVKTESVTINVSTSNGASASGITITINGSATTTNADGVAYGEVPFDTEYSIVFSDKTNYSTPTTITRTALAETYSTAVTYTLLEENCTVTTNVATTITINGNSKSNTTSHSRSIPYGTTYSVSVLSTVGEYTASTTSHTYTASQSSRSVSFTYLDPYNGHAYVDLGLTSGTKWATENLKYLGWTYYKYGYVDHYNYSQDNYTGRENPLSMSHDIARVRWGGSWHLPTSAQCQELIDECTWTWGTSGGTNGYTVKSKKNKNQLFLPALGYTRTPGGEQEVGEGGRYLTSTPYFYYACYLLYFNNSDEYPSPPRLINIDRDNGFTPRPVVG